MLTYVTLEGVFLMSDSKLMIINKISNELKNIKYKSSKKDLRRIIDSNKNIIELIESLFDNKKEVNIDFFQEESIDKVVKDLILFYIEEKNYKIDITDINITDSDDKYLSDNQIIDYINEIDKIPMYSNEEKEKVFPKHKEIREHNKKLRIGIIGPYFNIIKEIANKFKAKNFDYNTILFFELDLINDDIKKQKFISDKKELKKYLINKVSEFENKKKHGRNLNFDFESYENVNTTLKDSLILYKEHLKSYELEKNIRNDIVKHNMRLVVKKAYEFKRRYPTHSLIDLIQDGMEALINILDNDFDYEISSLSTYSYDGIEYRLRKAIERNDGIVRLSSNMRSKLFKYNSLLANYYESFNRYPTNEEICEALSITPDKLNEIIFASNVKQLSSLDEPIQHDDDEGVLSDFVKDNKISVEEEVLKDAVYDEILKILDNLDDATKVVLMARNGFAPKDTICIKKKDIITIISNHPLYSKDINKYLNDNFLDIEIHDRLSKNISKVITIKPNVVYVTLERDVKLKLEDIGKLLNVSRERIRIIEKKGLDYLRTKKGPILKKLLD